MQLLALLSPSFCADSTCCTVCPAWIGGDYRHKPQIVETCWNICGLTLWIDSLTMPKVPWLCASLEQRHPGLCTSNPRRWSSALWQVIEVPNPSVDSSTLCCASKACRPTVEFSVSMNSSGSLVKILSLFMFIQPHRLERLLRHKRWCDQQASVEWTEKILPARNIRNECSKVLWHFGLALNLLKAISGPEAAGAPRNQAASQHQSAVLWMASGQLFESLLQLWQEPEITKEDFIAAEVQYNTSILLWSLWSFKLFVKSWFFRLSDFSQLRGGHWWCHFDEGISSDTWSNEVSAKGLGGQRGTDRSEHGQPKCSS